MCHFFDVTELILVHTSQFLGVSFHVLDGPHGREPELLPSFKGLLEQQLGDHRVLGELEKFHLGGLSVALGLEVAEFPADDALVLDVAEVVLGEDLVLVVVELLVVFDEGWFSEELHEVFPVDDKQRTILLRNSLILTRIPTNKRFKPKILAFLFKK